MPFTLNVTQMQTLQSLRSQSESGVIEYWQIYKWLADEMMSSGVARSDPTVLWLRGATEANADRGAMSTLIRECPVTQYQLRYGIRLERSDPVTQGASNGVARIGISIEPQGPTTRPQYCTSSSRHQDGRRRGNCCKARTLGLNCCVSGLPRGRLQQTSACSDNRHEESRA